MVRVGDPIHALLCDEANRLGVSLNWLCTTKLQQPLGPTTLPTGRRRGRTPGKADASKLANLQRSTEAHAHE